MRRCVLALTLVVGFVSAASGQPAKAASGPYQFIKEIKIGGEGSCDFLTLDPVGRRLYVSHATTYVVVDIDTDTVVGQITDTPGAHGFAVAGPAKRGFTTNGREAKSSMVDLTTLKTITKIDTGKNPDYVMFEPGSGQIYSFNPGDKNVTVIDPKAGTVVTTIALAGSPELAAADPRAGQVYVNIADNASVAVIDTKTHAVVANWPITPGEDASGMAIDLANHRLFLGTGNKMIVVVDSKTGKVVTSVPAGAGIDGAEFDPGTKLVFTPNGGDGTVTIARAETPDKLVVVQTLQTQVRAKTMALDPKTHRIYLGVAEFTTPTGPDGKPGRPTVVPGSLKVLVYGLRPAQ
jgi:YVTN family beta-propeller protein